MTACLSAQLYALRALLANGRECADSPRVLRLTIGGEQASEWIAALDAACEQLDQAEDAPRIWTGNPTREEWMALLHDEHGRRRTVKDVAASLGCTDATVRRWLKQHDIPNLCETLQIRVWDQGENNGNGLGGEPAPRGLAAVGD